MQRVLSNKTPLDASYIAAAVASLTYAAMTVAGHPVLRHDWGAGPFHSGWSSILSEAFSGWNVTGIGSRSLYPDAYVISVPIALLTALAGNRAALFITLLAAGGLAAFAGRALAKDAGAGRAVSTAATILCVFNPWTYTELVAGHVFMLLAYAASIWLFRELLLFKPRPIAIVAAAVLTLQQLQFFLVTTMALLAFAAVRRRWGPFGIIALLWIPIAIAVVFDPSPALGSVPFIVAWERQQSIEPLNALQATGYFAGYARGFSLFGAIPMLYTFAIFLVAFIALMDRRVLVVGVGTMLALVLAMGLRGPLLPQMEWLTLHVRGAVLYRELFDILAYVVIGYCVLAAKLCAQHRSLGWSWLAALALLAIPWFSSPPFHHWVPASALPPIALKDVPANTRFALVPAFQPMSFAGRGSGRDPNLEVLPDNVTPVNEAFATYPTDAALGAYLLHGDASMLQALSVSNVVERPWLQSQNAALAQQWALPFHGFPQPRRAQVVVLRPQPELALLPMPAVGTLDAQLGGGNIFYGDAAEARGALVPAGWMRLGRPVPLTAANSETHAARGWVDARLAFAQRPELAQPFGGALTTNASAVLPLPRGRSALVFVEGTLRTTGGRMLTRTTRGYRWILTPTGTPGVVCAGLCVVAATGDPPNAPLEPPPHTATPVPFRLVTPWLIVADVPRGPAGALRYNTAYAKGWSAYLLRRSLSHVRLDGTVNGWLLPQRLVTQPLVVVDVVSAAQFASELLVVAILCWLGAIVAYGESRVLRSVLPALKDLTSPLRS